MLNYYELLEIESDLVGPPLEQKVIELQKKWIRRQNAPDLERRQEAERMLKYIHEAESILLDAVARADYDAELGIAESPYEENHFHETNKAYAEQLWIDALQLMEDERYAQLIEVMNQLTVIDAYDIRYWDMLGFAYVMWGEEDAAITAYREAANLQPTATEYHNKLSDLYLNHSTMNDAEKIKLAKLSNSRSGSIDNQHIDYITQAGEIEVRVGNLGQGLSYFEQALTIEPNNPYVHTALSNIYLAIAIQNHTLYVQNNQLHFFVAEEDAKKAIMYLEKSMHYATSSNDKEEIQSWLAAATRSLKTQFNNPGLKTILIVSFIILGLLSMNSPIGLLLAAGVGYWFYKVNWIPGWKRSKKYLGLR